MATATPGVPTTLGRYRIAEKIGAGGMGEVYRARDERLNRDVAIKLLPLGALPDETARKHFRKEALALSKLNHPHVETIFDFDNEAGIDFIVTEYIPGEGLDHKLARGGLSEREIARLGAQLAEGLAAAHEQGIIHRDLKPSNLRITTDGRLKILDFGLAKLTVPVSFDASTATMSESTRYAGTLPYMSPEQVRGAALDARTDVWAAGAVLYEMATGHRPFRAPGLDVVEEILHQSPAVPSSVSREVSPALDLLILKCLDKDPEARYQSARELAVDLRRLQTGGVVIAMPPTAMPLKWSSAIWVVLGLLVVAGLVLLFSLNIDGWRNRLSAGTGGPGIKSVAVLPVKNFSGDPAQEFFADGMTEALIADLAQIKTLKVISRTSVMHYKGSSETLPQIAKELGVDGIVEASVVRSGDRVRLTAQLIDARQDRHLWVNNYERNMVDVLALQSELVQSVVGEIQAQLTLQERDRLKVTRRVDPAVYDLTLKGKAVLEYATREEEFRQGIELFQKAVGRDPTYAPAWAGLAESLWGLAETGIEAVAPAEVRNKAIAAADRALRLDPNLADAHKARAVIALDGEWDLVMAQRHFEKALELRPSDAAAHNLYSQMLYSPLQRFEEARLHWEQARGLDPLSPWNDINLVAWWLFQGRPEKALEEAARVRQRNPRLWVIPWEMGAARLLMGRPNQAVADLEAAVRLQHPDRSAVLLAPLGLAYGLAGRQADALKILGEMQMASKKRYISPYYLAVVNSGLGRMDEAFRLLDQALEQRTPYLVMCTSYDPLPVALRRDPRWKHFVARLRQQVQLPPGTRDPYS